MSASACVAFYGLRFMILPDEIEDLEARTDPRQIAARRAGLATYWGNFGGENDGYVLFVGTKVAFLGPENAPASALPHKQMLQLMSDTMERLNVVGLAGDVGLYMEWQPDA
ncbi:hypothetical protein [Sphingomonas colocasiae]|uniref:Uncharacterized protein n=1 Tax=Sphingomonas colocasiae TaxID=1848973 RepID=A0ABS7PUT2_9SPHN|nr:hypothetical protein [Sphingomonas colocasiae]MBY8825116.1 hypothetical protein [Sphingomonas colocasiae]